MATPAEDDLPSEAFPEAISGGGDTTVAVPSWELTPESFVDTVAGVAVRFWVVVQVRNRPLTTAQGGAFFRVCQICRTARQAVSLARRLRAASGGSGDTIVVWSTARFHVLGSSAGSEAWAPPLGTRKGREYEAETHGSLLRYLKAVQDDVRALRTLVVRAAAQARNTADDAQRHALGKESRTILRPFRLGLGLTGGLESLGDMLRAAEAAKPADLDGGVEAFMRNVTRGEASTNSRLEARVRRAAEAADADSDAGSDAGDGGDAGSGDGISSAESAGARRGEEEEGGGKDEEEGETKKEEDVWSVVQRQAGMSLLVNVLPDFSCLAPSAMEAARRLAATVRKTLGGVECEAHPMPFDLPALLPQDVFSRPALRVLPFALTPGDTSRLTDATPTAPSPLRLVVQNLVQDFTTFPVQVGQWVNATFPDFTHARIMYRTPTENALCGRTAAESRLCREKIQEAMVRDGIDAPGLRSTTTERQVAAQIAAFRKRFGVTVAVPGRGGAIGYSRFI